MGCCRELYLSNFMRLHLLALVVCFYTEIELLMREDEWHYTMPLILLGIMILHLMISIYHYDTLNHSATDYINSLSGLIVIILWTAWIYTHGSDNELSNFFLVLIGGIYLCAVFFNRENTDEYFRNINYVSIYKN